MYIYLLVIAAYFWLMLLAWKVWDQVKHCSPERKQTHFAQHQVVFAIAIAVLAICLSVATMSGFGLPHGILGRWWVIFDVAVAFMIAAQLKYLEHSLSAGRQG